MTNSVDEYNWKKIGLYGCWGLPYVHQDPNNPDDYITTWQRYAYRPAGHQVEDVKFAIYNAKTNSFSSEKYVFDPRNMTIMQGHPTWGYSHEKYRVFYCQKSNQGDFIAEVTGDTWSDLQRYVVSNKEPVVTPDLGTRPHMVFLPVDSSTAWLFYVKEYAWAYSIFDKDKGWDRVQNFIPINRLVGSDKIAVTPGSALKEDDDILLYSSVSKGENAGNAYRFETSDKGKTWTVTELSISGITNPFLYNVRGLGGRLFVRVVKKENIYYMSSQSHAFHRWLAKSNDGIHFELVADFGEKRSLSNAMANIEGTSDILLIYANWLGGELGGEIECLVYDTEQD